MLEVDHIVKDETPVLQYLKHLKWTSSFYPNSYFIQ